MRNSAGNGDKAVCKSSKRQQWPENPQHWIWARYREISISVFHRLDSLRSLQIDDLFQSLPTPPSLHIIIEPHPDILQHMRKLSWHTKAGVKILEGKWQDFIDSEELLAVGGFDVIYTDTFSEDYKGGKH